MNFKKTSLLILAVLAAGPVFSQSDDFGIWTSLSAEKEVTKKFSVEAGFDFRSENNLKDASRWSGTLGFNYKLARFLKLGAGYVYIYDFNPSESKVNFTPTGKVNGYNVDDAFWQSKHRAYFDVTGSLKAGRFKFSLRERYQYTHSTAENCNRIRFRDVKQPGYMGDVYEWEGEDFMRREEVVNKKNAKDKHYLRSRAKVSYNVPKLPLNPFISYELSNDLEDGLDLDKTRLIVGTEWKITKKHIVTMGYLYQHGTDGKHEGGNHVLDLGYKFSF